MAAMLNMWWPTRINLYACLRAVVTRAKVHPGEDVLVLGASGGVAVAAIQIFKLIGARVFAITSSEKILEKNLSTRCRLCPQSQQFKSF
jgi:NADPH:quinone reductase-like Zn-dependent oxidoreductase